MALFLDGIFDADSYSPSQVVINFPMIDSTGSSQSSSIVGLLVSEVTTSSQIKWGPILSDLTNLQDVASLMGSAHMWSWIGASTMCWKGTDPIKTSIDFMLINYKPGLRLEEKLANLHKLASLERTKDKNGKTGLATVQIHGGYVANILSTNEQMFDNNVERTESDTKQTFMEKVLSPFRSLGEMENLEQGTISVELGNKLVLSEMLLNRIDVTPSLVEVPDKKPLYYKVSISLIGARPLLSTQVEAMYQQ